MENGQVENRVTETISQTAHLDYKLNSDSMEDSVEFRLMMAYAQRRRPAKVDAHKENGSATDQTPTRTPAKTEKQQEEGKKKKRKLWKHLKVIFKCVRPQTAKPEPPQAQNDDRCFVPTDDEDKEQDALGEVAARMIGITDEIHFTSDLEECSDIEKDGEDDLEKVLGLLLREDGDRLNEKFNLAHIAADLFFDYNFFTKLLDTFLIRTGFRRPTADALGPQAANRTQIAAALEITSRLTTVEALPKSQLYKHGARYLQEYYSSWAQTQGGYEAVFQDEEEVD
ncbi:uncharacterized protein FYW61_020873 [Anableps anableps]